MNAAITTVTVFGCLSVTPMMFAAPHDLTVCPAHGFILDPLARELYQEQGGSPGAGALPDETGTVGGRISHRTVGALRCPGPCPWSETEAVIRRVPEQRPIMTKRTGPHPDEENGDGHGHEGKRWVPPGAT